jgi:hypothetical protein
MLGSLIMAWAGQQRRSQAQYWVMREAKARSHQHHRGLEIPAPVLLRSDMRSQISVRGVLSTGGQRTQQAPRMRFQRDFPSRSDSSLVPERFFVIRCAKIWHPLLFLYPPLFLISHHPASLSLSLSLPPSPSLSLTPSSLISIVHLHLNLPHITPSPCN